MGALSALGRLLAKWYVAGTIFGALGIVLGFMVFFNVWPGKPKIGVIDIPFTVIGERATFEITALLDYARRTDSIKAVVISINSPGGGAAASEELYFQTAKLREKKPVVMVMNGIVASGGYMMSLGSNYMYAKPSSFVGSVGVILSPAPPLIPGPPREQNVLTGPFKAQGGDRKHFVALTDQLKRSFAQLVEIERGAKLTITIDQVTQAGIYSGIEGVRLGLVDGIGGREDAIQKAASLASITGYDLVDVNTEVARIMNEKLDRIWEPLDSKPLFATAYVDRPGLADTLTGEEALGDATGLGILPWGGEAEVLRTLPFPGGLGEDPATALPDFPLKINGPNVYYLYVGPTP